MYYNPHCLVNCELNMTSQYFAYFIGLYRLYIVIQSQCVHFLGFQTATFMNGLTEFQTLSHPKVHFQCMEFERIDYVKYLKKLQTAVVTS